jgi:hypothetical protein
VADLRIVERDVEKAEADRRTKVQESKVCCASGGLRIPSPSLLFCYPSALYCRSAKCMSRLPQVVAKSAKAKRSEVLELERLLER